MKLRKSSMADCVPEVPDAASHGLLYVKELSRFLIRQDEKLVTPNRAFDPTKSRRVSGRWADSSDGEAASPNSAAIRRQNHRPDAGSILQRPHSQRRTIPPGSINRQLVPAHHAQRRSGPRSGASIDKETSIQ